MIDVITATIAAITGFAALVGLMSWAQSQRESNLRQRPYNYNWPEHGHYSGSCICTPGRELDLSQPGTYDATTEAHIGYADTTAIDAMMERHRHEMNDATERERYYQRLQDIYDSSQAIPRPAQTVIVVAPQPARRPQRALPQPHTVEVPTETQTADGYRWEALEKEIAECQS